ncbi:lipocalin family protein [Pseudomonas syringae]|uniref:lipocalin family protein n=1 Tax=Pseudomonas syringae TaxID=317 RepID=UPI001F870AB6|nr:hypothetical protein [Pseudomonas syringae]
MPGALQRLRILIRSLLVRSNRENVWLLSRMPSVNGTRRQRLLEIAGQQGQDTRKLNRGQEDAVSRLPFARMPMAACT